MKKSFTVLVQDLDIKITNGIYFTPLLVAAHDDTTHLFMAASAASSHLQAMAEGSDHSGIIASGSSENIQVQGSATQPRLTLASMLINTNDGFIGLGGVDLGALTMA